MTDIYDNLSEARKLIHELNLIQMDRWHHFAIPTFRWWLLLAFLIGPWIAWVKVADRRRLVEILLFGALIMIVTILLDTVGYYSDFWDYPTEMIPMVPGSWAFDLSMVPVAYMLLYQYCPKWKTYLASLLVMAAVYAFIGEPLANGLILVLYLKWSNYYSFFLYLAFGIGIRLLVDSIKSRQAAAAAAQPSHT